jgi:hypothetical protein
MKRLLTIIIGLFILTSLQGQILRYSNYTALPAPPSGSNDFLTNLVAYYKLNETGAPSGADVVDSQNGHNGTIGGTVSRDGSSYDFDGSTGYVEMTDHADLQMTTEDVSVSIWVYVHAYPESGAVTGFIGGETNSFGFAMYHMAGELIIERVNSAIPSRTLGFYPALNSWTHIVTTFDNSETTNNCKYYINGTAFGDQIDFDVNFDSGSGTIYLGKNKISGEYYNGLMKDVAIWKGRILTQDEVTDLYGGGTSPILFDNFQ